jgi:hypothetical protein
MQALRFLGSELLPKKDDRRRGAFAGYFDSDKYHHDSMLCQKIGNISSQSPHNKSRHTSTVLYKFRLRRPMKGCVLSSICFIQFPVLYFLSWFHFLAERERVVLRSNLVTGCEKYTYTHRDLPQYLFVGSGNLCISRSHPLMTFFRVATVSR